jgi:hypothetical protein
MFTAAEICLDGAGNIDSFRIDEVFVSNGRTD